MTTAEAAAPNRELLYSPYKRFRLKHCLRCTENCNPTEGRFLICVLTALLDTISRNNEFNRYRGAHL